MYYCIHKSIDFRQQSACDKWFWKTMITNSKWSLILRFSFGHIFKFVSQHKLNPSEILSFQGRITGVPNRVYATVFMVKERICLFYTSILILTDLRLFFEVCQAHLPAVKQEITEKFWLWKYTYWAVIMVKSAKVCQNTFRIGWYQNPIISLGLERFNHD